MAKYKKICVYCGKDYESDSRNQRYCSDECCAKAQDKNYKVKKKRARKRREYSKTEEIQRCLSSAYALSHKVAEAYEIPKVCVCKLRGEVDEENECSGDLELNHKNCNPFDNSPWNLEYRCEKHHKVFHAQIPSVNVVECYKKGVEEAKDYHEMERSDIMVSALRIPVGEVGREIRKGDK